jgi:hypothetical protein
MSGRALAAIVAWAGLFGAALSLVALGVLQFMNPDMTRTRLLLTYWPAPAACCACIVVSAVAEWWRDRR